MTIKKLYEAIDNVNNNSITPSEFIELTYDYIKKIVIESNVLSPEDMLQDVVVDLMEKIKRGKKLNKTFLKWQIQEDIARKERNKDSYESLSNIIYVMDTDRIAKKIFLKDLEKCLKERELYVIKKRFYENLTLQEVGKELHLSTDRIRQIEAKALRKMRRSSYSYDVRELV